MMQFLRVPRYEFKILLHFFIVYIPSVKARRDNSAKYFIWPFHLSLIVCDDGILLLDLLFKGDLEWHQMTEIRQPRRGRGVSGQAT